jgi:hypothetical protein
MPSQKRSFDETLEENEEESENEMNSQEQPNDEDGNRCFSYLNYVTVSCIFV